MKIPKNASGTTTMSLRTLKKWSCIPEDITDIAYISLPLRVIPCVARPRSMPKVRKSLPLRVISCVDRPRSMPKVRKRKYTLSDATIKQYCRGRLKRNFTMSPHSVVYQKPNILGIKKTPNYM